MVGQDGSDGEPQGVFTGCGWRGGGAAEVQPGRAGSAGSALPRAESWCPLPTILRPVCNVLTDVWRLGQEKPFFASLPGGLVTSVGHGGGHIWLLEETWENYA